MVTHCHRNLITQLNAFFIYVAALTRKLPEVHVLLGPEILIYRSLEAHEQVTDWKKNTHSKH